MTPLSVLIRTGSARHRPALSARGVLPRPSLPVPSPSVPFLPRCSERRQLPEANTLPALLRTRDNAIVPSIGLRCAAQLRGKAAGDGGSVVLRVPLVARNGLLLTAAPGGPGAFRWPAFSAASTVMISPMLLARYEQRTIFLVKAAFRSLNDGNLWAAERWRSWYRRRKRRMSDRPVIDDEAHFTGLLECTRRLCATLIDC